MLVRPSEALNVLRVGPDPVLSQPVGQLPIRQMVTDPALAQRAHRHVHQMVAL